MFKRVIAFAICSVILNFYSITLSQVNLKDDSTKKVAGHRVFNVLTKNNGGKPRHINTANSIYQTSSKNFLIGSVLGFYEYNESLNSWETISVAMNNTFSPMPSNITEDAKKRVWVFSYVNDAVWYKKDESWQKLDRILDSSASNRICRMFSANNGIVWFVCKNGLVRYDGEKWGEIIPVPRQILSTYQNLPIKEGEPIYAKLRELEGKTDKLSDENNLFDPDSTSSGIEDSDGNIWIGTRKAILKYSIRLKKWMLQPLPESLISVSRMYEDREGRIWIADDYANLAILDKQKSSYKTYNLKAEVHRSATYKSTERFFISGIYQDKNKTMMFATGGGLVTFSEIQSKWNVLGSYNSALPGSYITCIYEDQSGRIWIGTDLGIVILEP
jgi:ligand-binding sensor domain-containing protein